MRMSCCACRKVEATGKRFNCGRRRLMMSGAPIFRSFKGFSAIKMFPVLVAPPPPVNAITFWTAESLAMTASILWMESFMAGKDASWGPCTLPAERASVLLREKAFGNFVGPMTTFRAMVRSKNGQGQPGIVQNPMQAVPVPGRIRSKNLSDAIYRRPCFRCVRCATGTRTSSAWW